MATGRVDWLSWLLPLRLLGVYVDVKAGKVRRTCGVEEDAPSSQFFILFVPLRLISLRNLRRRGVGRRDKICHRSDGV
jgi:hypothetical protein